MDGVLLEASSKRRVKSVKTLVKRKATQRNIDQYENDHPSSHGVRRCVKWPQPVKGILERRRLLNIV